MYFNKILSTMVCDLTESKNIGLESQCFNFRTLNHYQIGPYPANNEISFPRPLSYDQRVPTQIVHNLLLIEIEWQVLQFS